MIEEPIQFGVENNLFGILSQPKHDVKNVGILFLNAGFVYHVGPNRIHVELARIISDLGFHSFRFDFAGFGESLMDTDKSTFEEYTTKNVIEAMNVLSENYGLANFILFGICSGADIAFKAALEDERVTGCYIINGSFHPLNEQEKIHPIAVSMTKSRYYKKNLFNLEKWMKLFSIKKIATIASKLRLKSTNQKNIKIENPNPDILSEYTLDNWNKLLSRNTKLKLVYAEGSDTLDIFNMRLTGLNKYINADKMAFEIIKDVDHVFTPHWAQEKLEKSFINWIKNNYN